MALIGDYNHSSWDYSDTETETVTITYPEILPENDPNYEKKGTTETLEVPLQIENITEYKDIYLVISAITLQKQTPEAMNLNFAWQLYNSKAEREEDFSFTTPLLNAVVSIDWDPNNIPDNPYVIAYDYLKTQKGFENLVND
jgi:hypothetical protein